MAWKVHQVKDNVKRNIHLALLTLGLLLVLLISGKVISLVYSFNLPFTKSLVNEKSRSWDSKSSFNLVYATEKEDGKSLSQISLINFNPKDRKLTILSVSDLIYSELPRGYGKWRVSSIYPLGEEEGDKKGVVLLKLSMSKILGLPIDGIFISKNTTLTPEQMWTKELKNPFKFIQTLSHVKTDLTPFEFIRLLLFSSHVRADKVVSLDLSQSSITESKLLPDSSRVLGINYINLDNFIRDNLIDPTIYEENQTVAIFNATDKALLGQEVARVVTNLGANVVLVSNTENYFETSQVITKEEGLKESPITSKRLTDIFAPNCLKSPCINNDPRITNSRALINIIIGKDYYRYWYQKSPAD